MPLNRAMSTFYMLSLVAMSPSAAVWLQFLMKKIKLAVSKKRCEIRPRLLLITNKKSHTLF